MIDKIHIQNVTKIGQFYHSTFSQSFEDLKNWKNLLDIVYEKLKRFLDRFVDYHMTNNILEPIICDQQNLCSKCNKNWTILPFNI